MGLIDASQRQKIELLLDDSPSLRREVADRLAYAYPRACLQASNETGLTLATFPAPCPYTAAQVLDDAFFPEAQ